MKITPAPVPPLGGQNRSRRQPRRVRVGTAAAGAQESEDDHKLLRRHRHPPGRTRSRRPHHEAPRIQVGPGAPSPDSSAARGLAPCADLNRDCTYPMANGRRPTGCSGSGPWAAMIPFAEAAGARLAKASQHRYLFAWRRFLGFLAIHEPTALEVAPTERLTIERVRAFVAHLAETNTPRSVASQLMRSTRPLG